MAIHIDHSLWDSADLWEHFEQDVFRLHPGHFVLTQTLEKILIPEDVVGLVEGRSSCTCIRRGVDPHLCKVTSQPLQTGASIPGDVERFENGFVVLSRDYAIAA